MNIWRSKGIVKYDPRSDRSTFKKWWVILQCDREIVKYYQHIFYKLYWKRLQTAIWNSHCSIVRGEKPLNLSAWKLFDGKMIEFEYMYDGQFHSNTDNGGKHFWIKVKPSPFFATIRASLGLSPEPRINYHLSVGTLQA